MAADNTLQANLDAEAATRSAEDDNLAGQIDTAVPQSLLDLAPYVSVDQNTLELLYGPHIIFEGANVHVRNTLGTTYDIDGLGNLIVGYNENDIGDDIRDGSHNIVVGTRHTYTSYGGLVAGHDNVVSHEHSSVTGGRRNIASGRYSSVSGGLENEAQGSCSSVSGDLGHTVTGSHEHYEAIPVPDYDSGWVALCQGCSQRLDHNLGGDPENYVVDLQFDSDHPYDGVNNIGYGLYLDYEDDRHSGGDWNELTDQSIVIERGLYDTHATRLRVRIWITAE